MPENNEIQPELQKNLDQGTNSSASSTKQTQEDSYELDSNSSASSQDNYEATSSASYEANSSPSQEDYYYDSYSGASSYYDGASSASGYQDSSTMATSSASYQIDTNSSSSGYNDGYSSASGVDQISQASGQRKEPVWDYYGTAPSFHGDIEVRVKVAIEEIEVTKHQDTIGVGSLAFDKLPQEMVQANSIDVDTISSATISSNALKKAVTDALYKAYLDMTLQTDKSSDEDGFTTGSDQYLGTGQGIHGDDLVVRVTSSDGITIEKVEILDHNETPGISDGAINTLPDLIVEANSTDVDSISGVTATSKAIKDAVKDAMANKNKGQISSQTPSGSSLDEEAVDQIIQTLVTSHSFKGAIKDAIMNQIK